MKDKIIIMETQSRIIIYVRSALMVKTVYGSYTKIIANVGYSENNVTLCYFMITVNDVLNIDMYELVIMNNALNNSGTVNHTTITNIYLETIVYTDIKPIILNAAHLRVIGCKEDQLANNIITVASDIRNYLWETTMYKVK